MSRHSAKEYIIGITGMTCTSCSSIVENSLSSIKGVKSASVNLSTNTATIEFESSIDIGENDKIEAILKDTIESVGFDVDFIKSKKDEKISGLDESSQLDGADLYQANFSIEGMTCTSCSNSVENLLRDLKGIKEANVNLSTNSATVLYDNNLVDPRNIINEIESIGFDVEIISSIKASESNKKDDSKDESLKPKEIFLVPLTPNRYSLFFFEELSVKFSDLKGVQKIEWQPGSLRYKVTFDELLVGPRDFINLGTILGVELQISTLGGFMLAARLFENQKKELKEKLGKLIFSCLLTIPILFITMLLPLSSSAKNALDTEIIPGLNIDGFLLFILTTPVQFIVGHQFHKKALSTIKTMNLGMDFMISTGTTAAYIYSTIGLILGILNKYPNDEQVEFYETSAVLITAVLFGKFLETYAKGRTSAAIHNLMSMKPNNARLVKSGTESQIITSELDSSVKNKLIGILFQEKVSNIDQIIDSNLLHKNDIIRLVSGEKIPADGELLTGSLIGVDESMMTGESRIIPKKEREHVYGGTTVVEGSGLMRVVACGDESTLGKIITTMQEAQASKPPIQELADNVARYFVPVVAIISLLVFILWISAYELGWIPKNWYENEGNPYFLAFFFALAVWVSACPCAFGLATPTAILVSTGIAANNGILVRRGASLQFASNINAIAFDKTGTLTQGIMEVTDFYFYDDDLEAFSNYPFNNINFKPRNSALYDILSYLYLAEKRSNHPLAKGITSFCESYLPILYELTAVSSLHQNSQSQLNVPDEMVSFEVVPGDGVHLFSNANIPLEKRKKFNFESINVLVGSSNLMISNDIKIPFSANELALNFRQSGKIVFYISIENKLKGIVAVADTIRPESPMIINYLNRIGIECFMVTGDEIATAKAIARKVNIPQKNILASAKPDDKSKFVSELKDLGHCVAFVGDGSNDSPALAMANVGFTMSGGSDIAIEAGDMVICKNDLSALLVAHDLSKKTINRIKLNYFWALCYNMVLIPVASGVFYPSFHFALAPMMAGAAMALSSVSIVLSSLMLIFYQPPNVFDSANSNYDAFNPLSKKDKIIKKYNDPELEPLCECEPFIGEENIVADSIDPLSIFKQLRRFTESSSEHSFQKISMEDPADSNNPIHNDIEMQPLPSSKCNCGASNCKCPASCRCK